MLDSIYRIDISLNMSASSLELSVLGLLKEGAMHGYELSKRLAITLGPLYRVSYGSLYPCLKRLKKSGLVVDGAVEPATPVRRRSKAEAVERRVKPRATRRGRKVYEITPEGERFFFDQLEQGAVYDTDGDRFQTRFAFFRYLPTESRIGLLERRKAYLQEKLIEFKESLQSTKERIDAYTRSLHEHGVDAMERDIRWLEELIEQERGDPEGRPARRN
jgi:DNA-binding PadR family transcriptional regulator